MGTFGIYTSGKQVNRIVFSGNHHMLVSLSVSDAQVFQQRSVGKTGYENRSCAWSPDGSYIAWSYGRGRVKVLPWNNVKSCLLTDDDTNTDGTELKHDRVMRTFDAGSHVYSLAFGSKSSHQSSGSSTTRYRYKVIADDLILAAGLKDGRIRLWNVKTGVIFLVLMDHTGAVHDINFAPGGSLCLLSASLDGSLKLWDIEDDGNMSHTFRIKSSQTMMGCAWSPDGRMICGVGGPRSDQMVQVWDVESQASCHFRGHLNTVCSCQFSKDGFFLVTSSYDTMVIVWNVQTSEILQKLYHLYPPPKEWLLGGYNDSHVRDLSISPNGHHVVTVCDDSIVRVWDLLSSTSMVQEVAVVPDALSCMFSPGGACIAVGTSDGSLQIFEAPSYKISLQSLCRFAIHNHLKRCRCSSQQKLAVFNTLPPALQAFLSYQHLVTKRD